MLQYVQVSSGLNHYFLVITHRQTPRHTDRHEYFIVAVDKPQLQKVNRNNKISSDACMNKFDISCKGQIHENGAVVPRGQKQGL